MKVFLNCLIASCLLITNVYRLEQETRKNLIEIYNFTRNQYIVVIRLLEDLSNSKVEATMVEKKLIE